MIQDTFDLRKLLEAQNQLVVMDNEFIQTHCNTLTSVEATTLAWLISKIKPTDGPATRYTVDCEELLVVMRWTNMRYNSVKAAMEGLTKAKWWLTGSDTVHQGYIVYEESSYSPRLLHVWFLQDTHKHLFELNQKYSTAIIPMRIKSYTTTYPLAYHGVMTHRHSVRLYQLLKSYSNKSSWLFEVGTGSHLDIHKLLAQWRTKDGKHYTVPPSWRNWGSFVRDVLEPALKDFKEYADITFTYKGLTHDMARHATRAVRCVRITIHQKTAEERQKATQAINAKYREYINAWVSKRLGRKRDKTTINLDTDIFVYHVSAAPATDALPSEITAIPADIHDTTIIDNPSFDSTPTDFAMLDVGYEDLPY